MTAGFLKVIDVLLENGTEVNAANKNGETPLFDGIHPTIKNGEKKKAGRGGFAIGRCESEF